MTEFKTSTTEPSYIAQLALQSAPFSAVSDSKNYYSATQSEHRLNLLLHLLRSTDKIGLLVAENGLGKTTLLNQLQHRVGDELRTCHLDGQQQLNSDIVLTSCLRALGLDAAAIEVSESLAETFKNQLKQLKKLNIKSVLLLDNAQMLSAESLTILSNWLNWQDDGDYLLQAVIASNNNIDLMVSEQSRIQMIDLPAIEKQELPTYLMYRLTSVGYQGSNPFSDKDLQQFYQLSSGNLELINQLAHQKLLGIKPTLSSPASFEFSFLAIGARWIGLGLLIALLAVLLGYQDNINQWLASSDVEHIEQDMIKIEEDSALATVIVEHDDIKTNEQAHRDELASLLAEMPELEVDVAPVIIPDETASMDLVEREQLVVENMQLVPKVYQQDWILQHQGSQYTFQLMGSWDKQEVDEFIEQYALTGDVAMFESMRNGRTWYAVIYGVFDSKKAALTASGNWPAPLNTLPSWLRRFDSVQKQIRNMAQEQ